MKGGNWGVWFFGGVGLVDVGVGFVGGVLGGGGGLVVVGVVVVVGLALVFLAFWLAPLRKRSCTQSKLPRSAARMSGVSPKRSLHSVVQPRYNNAFNIV